jgi:hypothetical protein
MKGAQDRRLSVLDAIKLLRHPLGLLSLVALIGIAWWRSPRSTCAISLPPTRYLSGLLTGLITFAFTLSIVNQFVLQRASLRWADIRGITLKVLT